MNAIVSHLSHHGTALQSGDIIKLGVLLSFDVLVVFSILSVAIVIERVLALRRASRLEDAEYGTLRDLWRRESPVSVRSRLLQSEAPSASAVRAGLELQEDLGRANGHSAANASPLRIGAPEREPGAVRELAREAIGQGLEVESAKLGRSLPLLATVASTAPYIGLFGTVLGILSAFAQIARTGQTGASAVAAPIAEALTATGLGLGVAIPAVMAYNFLSGRVGDLMLRVETHALDLSARLIGSEAPSAHAALGTTDDGSGPSKAATAGEKVAVSHAD
jgi:biopolymer transport protein ExbB/TolQ